MKNPFMSLWLSSANLYANMMRGFWAGELQRQQSVVLNAWMKNWMNIMRGAASFTPRRRRGRK